MARIGHLPDVPVHSTLGMNDPWRYRNKAQVPVAEREGGLHRWVLSAAKPRHH